MGDYTQRSFPDTLRVIQLCFFRHEFLHPVATVSPVASPVEVSQLVRFWLAETRTHAWWCKSVRTRGASRAALSINQTWHAHCLVTALASLGVCVPRDLGLRKMSNSATVKIENDLHQQHSAAARQLPAAESEDSPVSNETKPKLLSSVAGPTRVAVAPAPPHALISQPLQQNTKKSQVAVPRFSHAVASQLRPHHQQQRPLRLLGNFQRILRTPTRVFRVVTPSSGAGGGESGDNQQCKQNIGTGNCQPALPPPVATNVLPTAPVAATATATNATTAAAAAPSTTTSNSKTTCKMGVNGKQHWPKVSPFQRAPHIAMSLPGHPSYIIRAQASKPKQQQQQPVKPNNLLATGSKGNAMKRQQQKQKEVGKTPPNQSFAYFRSQKSFKIFNLFYCWHVASGAGENGAAKTEPRKRSRENGAERKRSPRKRSHYTP
uniref:Uncharacterized protein n=1 Tax=Globodera rostochiensis TaxID=31243 RepID=A0A914HAM5_GLORO